MNGTYADTIRWLLNSPDWEQALIELKRVWYIESDLRLSAAYLHQYIRDELGLADFDDNPDFLDPEFGQDDPF